MTNPHPNTTTQIVAGLAAAGLVKASNEWLGADLTLIDAMTIVVGVPAFVLLVGRQGAHAIWHTGVAGIWRHVIHGDPPPAPPPVVAGVTADPFVAPRETEPDR